MARPLDDSADDVATKALGLGLVVLATSMSDGDLTLPPVPLARRAARLPVATGLRQD